jgi:hypothetical protein
MKAYTDYPIIELGDKAGKKAPVREVEIISYDGDKYVTVLVENIQTEIKTGYIYETKGRFGEVKSINVRNI